MGFEMENFGNAAIDEQYLEYLIDQSADRYERLWNYFRNPMTSPTGAGAAAINSCSRPYFQFQEIGLPTRITGLERSGPGPDKPTDTRRKEVVIENDIAWRVSTMVDFLFGRAPVIRSLAAEPTLAKAIEQVVTAVLDASGGVSFLQEAALFGSVYGFVDVALRSAAENPNCPLPSYVAPVGVAAADGSRTTRGVALDARAVERAVRYAATLQLEAIEAGRVIPILAEMDYRNVQLWVQRFGVHPPRMEQSRRSWLGLFGRGKGSATPAAVEAIEILGPTWWQRYEDRQLVAQGPNALGRLPIVHIQNMSLSGSYAGLSDVEPLIPLQDELNTRLSDRAQRVTYQSFKMYLGKGIDDFLERPVGPGQMWATQNLDAHIEEFGSDSGSPSEDAHVQQVRQALDKVSGVPPLAAGLIGGNVGYLSSATALKVLLGGLLARTARKRLTYGHGLGQIVELILAWMDHVGVLKTSGQDRCIEVHWPNVLPTDEGEQLRNAQIKAQLGVPQERILAELGYDSRPQP